jgi:hypothetical protein
VRSYLRPPQRRILGFGIANLWLLFIVAATVVGNPGAIVYAQDTPVSPLETPTPVDTPTSTPTATFSPTPTATATATATPTPTLTPAPYQVSPLLVASESRPAGASIMPWIGGAALIVLAGSIVLAVASRS